MNSILLDTNILIYLLEGNKSLRDILEDKSWFISFINEMELFMKPEMTPAELKAIRSIIGECQVIEMNNLIKKKAILNAQTYKLKLADSIVMATAQVNNLPLITADNVFKKIAQTSDEVLLFVP